MNCEQIILDFINCKISYEDFIKNISDVKQFIDAMYQDCLDKGIKFDYVKSDSLNWIMTLKDNIFKKSSLYDVIFEISSKSGLYLGEKNKYYDKIFEFMNDYIPEYLLSNETEDILIKEIYNYSNEFKTKKELKEFIKTKCNLIFELSNGKRPYWVQESEWPVRNGKPCRYINRKREGERVIFQFQDVVNNELIFITQYS